MFDLKPKNPSAASAGMVFHSSFQFLEGFSFILTQQVESGNEWIFQEVPGRRAALGGRVIIKHRTLKLNSDKPPGNKNKDTLVDLALQFKAN